MKDLDPDDAIATAERMGLEADAEEARRWMVAVAASDPDDRIAADAEIGVFGDRVSLLDFDPDDLAHFRSLVPYVRIEPRPEIESAIAIAGSAAQGKIQLFPGDADFFERIHIHAETEGEAQRIFREAMRATALRAVSQPDIVLVEADLGTYPEPVVQRGASLDAGHTIEWTTPDVLAGRITVEAADGPPRTYEWDDADVASGWLYLYWIVADREQGRIALASNVMDVTWEDPAGAIRSLDGAIDPLVQEVYLEAGALALVERLQALVAPGAREAYRDAMREQVVHYSTVEPSFGKVAKRLYNLCRVADELEAAAYVRELFDEPQSRLYQVPGLLEAADHALDPSSGIDRRMVLEQIGVVRESIADATDGADEAALLAELRDVEEAALSEGGASGDWASALADVREQSSELVNEFFRTRLLAHDRIRELMDELAQG
ncbi:MAG: hypothetical protein WEC34_01670 [Acidimicrobiia bacterium]